MIELYAERFDWLRAICALDIADCILVGLGGFCGGSWQHLAVSLCDGENGGAAFVVVYLFCVFYIGVPILMAELFIGRRGGLSPSGSMQDGGGRERPQLVLGLGRFG